MRASTRLLTVITVILASAIPISSVVASSATPTASTSIAPDNGGVLLDGYGGLHAFGGASLTTNGSPYWAGWDIARAVSIMPGGAGGWTLDGYGGVHSWGAAPPISAPMYSADPSARAPAYWPGRDIARALVVLPDKVSGYELDGYGGLHNFGAAPPLLTPVYWGWDIARGLAIHMATTGQPDGGYVLDGWGGIHNFGAAPYLSSSHYTLGVDLARQFHLLGAGAYEVTRFGLLEPIANPSAMSIGNYPNWGSWDVVRDVFPLGSTTTASFTAPQPTRAQVSGLIAFFQNADRNVRGIVSLTEDNRLDAIAGNGQSYNLNGCGGPNVVIPDRTGDMLTRSYFGHPIPGCTAGHYSFNTYMPLLGISYRTAGENIAWTSASPSVLDNVRSINNAWLNSSDHLANITNGAYHSVGCGYADSPATSYQGFSGHVEVFACEFTG